MLWCARETDSPHAPTAPAAVNRDPRRTAAARIPLRATWDAVRASRLLREGGWLTAGEAGSMLARLVGVRVLTTLLVPATYGEIALLLGTVGLGIGVLFSPISIAAQRFYADAARARRVPLLRSVLSTILAWSIAATVVLILIGGWAWTSSRASGSYWRFVALIPFVVLEARRVFATGWLNAARRQVANSAWTTLDAWCKPLGAALFVVAFGRSATAALAGYAAGTALPFVALPAARDRDGAPATAVDEPRRGAVGGPQDAAVADADARSALMRKVLRYALPLAPMALLRWVGSVSDRYVLGAIGGAAATGVYVAAYALGSTPFLSFGRITMATFRPALFEALARGDRPRARLIFIGWLAVVAAGSTAGALLIAWQAERITGLILGEAFRTSATLLPWIAAGYVALNLQQVFEGALHARQQTYRLTMIQAVTAVSALTLYVVMIRAQGALGAARATFAVFALSCSLTIAVAALPWLRRRRVPAA